MDAGGTPRGARSSPGTRFARGALLGAAATGGWLLHDLAVFVTSGEPRVVLALIPGSLVALAVGTSLGALAGRWPALAAIYAAAGLAARLWPGRVHEALALLGPLAPRGPFFTSQLGAALAGFGLALLLAALGRRALGLPPARTAAVLGLVAALVLAYFRQGEEPTPHRGLLAGAATAILVLGHGRLPGLGPLVRRRLATGAVVLGTAGFLAYEGLPQARASYWRDDLAPPAAGAGQAPNLLLVVLDTVRAESLAPYGHERAASPELDAWVRAHATIHTEARATSSFTLATHGSLFTGVLPAQHKAARLRPASEPLAEELPTLAERLRERGFQTGAIVANGTYLNPRYDMDRGFEHFDFRKGAWVGRYLALAQHLGHAAWAGHLSYRDAHAITSSAIAWLDRRRREEPFFLFLNYLDAHTPYIPPAPHQRAFEEVYFENPYSIPMEHRELAYERNIHYLDSQIGRLLRAVEERGLLDGTVVVITSDHGEAFGEHGFWEHCWTLYDDVVKVPLYLKPAGGRRSEREDRPINSAQLTWLMLDELGVPYDPPPPMGSMVAEWYRQIPMTDKYLAIAERVEVNLDRDLMAWIEDGRKVIVSTERGVQAFDLASDPDEQDPLQLTQEEIDRAVVRAVTWWDAHPMGAEQTEEIPPEEMARLRALGYVGQEE